MPSVNRRRVRVGIAVLLLMLMMMVGTAWHCQRTRSVGVAPVGDLAGRTSTEASFTSAPLPATEGATLAEMERGASEEQVYAALGKPFRHEFVIRHEGKLYHAVSYAFERRWLRYYLLFRDGKLAKIIKPPDFPSHLEPMPDGRSNRKVVELIDPFQRVEQVLAAPDLSGSALDVKARLPKPSKDSNLGPLILMAPLLKPSEAQERETLRHNREREAHFDPARVSLGMSEAQVEAIYGPHIGERTESAMLCRAYGQWDEQSPWQDWHHPAPMFRFSWVVVCFDGAKTTAVFSDDFVDERRFIGLSTTRPVDDGGSGL